MSRSYRPARTRPRPSKPSAVAASPKIQIDPAAVTVARALVRPVVPARSVEPLSVTAHLGPTNSGKTYHAIEQLAQARYGAYVAPLRALAVEVYERLTERLGAGAVGLITGEQVKNPDADIVCCTPECAPRQAHTMVIDETHWLVDEQRGWAWTELIAAAEVEHLVILGASELEPLVRQALPGATVHHHTRLSTVEYGGQIGVADLEPGTVVVAFSRASVLAMAREIGQVTDHAVRTLYGAMPPYARMHTIDVFAAGDLDVLVCTDVIGHGINLPVQHVVMAQTTKHDGRELRSLHLWEAAQIVGRAGRFGLSEMGRAYSLSGGRSTASSSLVERATLVAAGKSSADLKVLQGQVRPKLGELGVSDASSLAAHLRAWEIEMRDLLAAHPWMRPMAVEPLVARCEEIRGYLDRLTVEQAWKLLALPVKDTTGVFARALARHEAIRTPADYAAPITDLESAERAPKWARDLMSFTRAFGDGHGITYADAAVLEHTASIRLTDLLPDHIREHTMGRCSDCGRPCPARLDQCKYCEADSWEHWTSESST